MKGRLERKRCIVLAPAYGCGTRRISSRRLRPTSLRPHFILALAENEYFNRTHKQSGDSMCLIETRTDPHTILCTYEIQTNIHHAHRPAVSSTTSSV